MYTIFVTYKGKDKKAVCGFYEEVKAERIIETTLNEDGCLRYDYLFPAGKENEVCLLEQWQDKVFQQEHTKKPHFAVLKELKEKYGIESELEEL